MCGGARQLAKVGHMTRHGAMCGTSGWGITSVLSPLLYTLNHDFYEPRHATPADGMVSLSSCTAAFDAWKAAGAQNLTFGERPTERFYRAAINHGDGMVFDAQGLGEDRQPLAWYENMIRGGWQA